jgi:hypothetical protein
VQAEPPSRFGMTLGSGWEATEILVTLNTHAILRGTISIDNYPYEIKQWLKNLIFIYKLAELVMHDERVERHIHGVQETLEQTDADYRRMLTDFSKSIVTYKDDIFGLENVFVNATTSGRLLSLQDRLIKKRDTFMENVRVSLRTFRKRFDDAMQYLRQANVKFRKSFK